ncbi:MAG: FkbM family methyltransferase [Flavobacteriales bacterium]|nr:FkbM family methyltransferase [Flavobacteriales bacterium]
MDGLAKNLAGPLSRLVANRRTALLSQWAETYLGVLLGKGAGTGWAIAAEVTAARSVIHTDEPVLFDVGAHLGEWSVLAKQHFSKARLILFEPQPSYQKAIGEHALSNSELIPFAVSSSVHRMSLFASAEHGGIASVHERRDSFFTDVEFVPTEIDTVTIDDVVAERGIEQVDFMKMDVEGHELDVLRGARKSLESGLIKALSFEFGSANINSRTYFHDFWDELTPLGYRISRILPSGKVLPIERYYEDCEYFRGATNYIAHLPKR